jgi:hypothetical protein
MQMISIIEQHIGDHPVTGLRLVRFHEVITEMDLEEAATVRIGNLHAVEVELASLDASSREKAEAWLTAHVNQINDPDKAAWIRRAIDAFVACVRCRVQASVDNATPLADQGWRRVNPCDVTSGLGLRWICPNCWKLLVRKNLGD